MSCPNCEHARPTSPNHVACAIGAAPACNSAIARDCTKRVKLGVRIREDKWPWAVRAVARKRQPGETGVGDTLKRLFGHLGGNVFKSFLLKLGLNCGCTARQAWLNERFRYEG